MTDRIFSDCGGRQMDYFNKELGGTPISSISLGNGTITIDKYDKIIDVLFKDIKQLQDVVFSQQEKRSKWREFDLEAATGREFETR